MPRLTTRDYKRPSRGTSAARLKDFGLGLLVGGVLASAAFLVAGEHARHHAATAAHGRAVGDSPGRAPRAPAAEQGSSEAASPAGPDPASSPPGAAAAPQYDFYRMLPRFQVPVPHDDARPSHAPLATAAAQPPRPETSGPSYVLQVGSYRSSVEAEQVRARLARVGLSAQVQRIVEGSTTWNRVRIGPLDDAELARVRGQLRTANLHALVIRADH